LIPRFRQYIFYFPFAELREIFALHRFDLRCASRSPEIEYWTTRNRISQQKKSFGLAAGFSNRQLVGTAFFFGCRAAICLFSNLPLSFDQRIVATFDSTVLTIYFYFPFAELREIFALHRIDLCRASRTREIEYWTTRNRVSQQKKSFGLAAGFSNWQLVGTAFFLVVLLQFASF
jgi:hypothetical protein